MERRRVNVYWGFREYPEDPDFTGTFHAFLAHDGKASAVVELDDGRVRVVDAERVEFVDRRSGADSAPKVG